MKIQVLYFEGCPNHQPAVDMARSVVAELGIGAVVEDVEVKTQADAERLRFFGSPTIQVDGVDIEPEARSRTDYAFSCRMYGTEGVPPREILVRAVTEDDPGPTPDSGCCGNGSNCCSEPQTPEDSKTSHNLTDRAGLAAAGGSVVSAMVASACCWLPLLLIALGLSAGGVSSWFAQWRPLFLVVAAVLLCAGFYIIYLRKSACEPSSACAVPNPKLRRFNRVMFWVATVAVLGFSFFPNYAGYLIGGTATSDSSTGDANVANVTFHVQGMTCEACATHIQRELMKVPGVKNASVSYSESQATVNTDASSPPSRDSLVEAVERAGYKVVDERHQTLD